MEKSVEGVSGEPDCGGVRSLAVAVPAVVVGMDRKAVEEEEEDDESETGARETTGGGLSWVTRPPHREICTSPSSGCS